MKLIEKIKGWTVLRRQYLEETIAAMTRFSILVVALNLILFFLIWLKRSLIRFMNFFGMIKRRYPIPRSVSEEVINRLQEPLSIPPCWRVLLVTEESIHHCFRYRVQQKIEQLKYVGHYADWVSWKDTEKVIQLMHFYHVVIFYRVPAFDNVLKEIEAAYKLKRIILGDIDDLIFNRKVMEQNILLFNGLSKREKDELLLGTDLYLLALQKMHYVIGSTPALCEQLEEVGSRVYLHRNALDLESFEVAEQISSISTKKYISIFYGSGTKTHDKDFEVAAPAIGKILEEYPWVRLVIGGYLSLPRELESFSERIVRIKFLSSISYWEILKNMDINIAPLQENIFSDCKSEIKWLEAGVLRVPSIVTPTRTYKEILHDGCEVFFAKDYQEWYEKLKLLIKDENLRQSMALKAQQTANRQYNLRRGAKNLKDIINDVIKQESNSNQVKLRSENKKKLIFVNVLYPPQDIGGATLIVNNQVEELSLRYGHKFEVAVLTYDLNCPGPYQIREYEHNNIHVTAVGVPNGNDIDWRYKDDRMKEIFKNFLFFHQPDLIHFHCVQRLTGSVLEAARDLGVPYFVTLHDAWWLCDRQFMINDNSEDCGQMSVDPLQCAHCLDDIDESIKRRKYLKSQLKGAKLLLAVSDYQKGLYEKNGFQNVTLNKNGIRMPVRSQRYRNNKDHDLLKLGYLGGVCTHKGYYFLKEVVENLALNNIEIIAVDFSFNKGENSLQSWGKNKVRYIPKIPFSKMSEFWSELDVVVLPSIWRESFGLVAREANAHGVWVVASDAGALAEDIQEGINGHVFEKGNKEQLAQILCKLNESHSYYKSTRPAKSPNINSVQEQVDCLVELYDQVLGSSLQ